MRYLANYIIYKNTIYSNSTAEVDEKYVSVSRFESETQNTIFVNGVIIISKTNLSQYSNKFKNILNSNKDLAATVTTIATIVNDLEKCELNSNNKYQSIIIKR